MPIQYKCDKHAIHTPHVEGEPETEQEHKDSCDINKMLHAAARGQQIRGNPAQNAYGYDDTTLDGVTHRIKKQELENQLRTAAKNQEFSEEELKHIPENVKQKIKFKVRKKVDNTKDAQQNDNSMTKKQASQNSQQQNEPKNEAASGGLKRDGAPSERTNTPGSQS